jgi:choline-sulfatase
MLGNHGMWTKMLMNEDSAGIPLILSGPGVPRGAAVDTPVSLVDAHPTILEGAGLALSEADQALPGRNLINIAEGAVPERTILSEFHDGGSPTGYFMVRKDDWKYVHYAGSRPQLFDLAGDPQEDEDRPRGDPRHGGGQLRLHALDRHRRRSRAIRRAGPEGVKGYGGV